MKKARLIFEDGREFCGQFFTAETVATGEVVFNTAMSGYQEVLTDPSYCGQMVLMTYPLIGSYGINDEDHESRGIFLSAFLVKEYIDFPSNWRSKRTVKQFLDQHGIPGAEGFDTRAITLYLREKGAQRAILTDSTANSAELMQQVQASPQMAGQNLVERVTCASQYDWEKPDQAEFRVAVVDCGVKYNILRQMREYGCACTVFPAQVTATELLAGDFDGVFISNGPGDPEPVKEVIQLIRDLLGKLPIFGICLGNQLLGLALGGRTYKLKFGHHGINHPVKNLKTGQVEITSQNHGFCVDMASLPQDQVEITHLNLNDETVEGFRHRTFPAFSVQYHPEAAPGPHESSYLFKEFTQLMREMRNSKR